MCGKDVKLQDWPFHDVSISKRFNKNLEDSIEQPQWFSSARPLWEVRRGFVPRFEAEIGVVPRNRALIFRAREDACISSPSKRKSTKEHKGASSTS